MASSLGVAALLALGVWQLQRLQWKSALIAEIEEKRARPPVSLSEALKRADVRDDVNHLSVEARGRFAGTPLFVLDSFEGKAGWSVVTPFLSADGVFVLVDRGQISAEERRRYEASDTSDATVRGLAGLHAGARNLFTPDNEPDAGRWYWRDIPAMLGAVTVPDGTQAAPFILHLLPDPTQSAGPKPRPPAANLRNNHLGYAITWFGLALTLAVMAAIFVRKRINVDAGRNRR